MKKTSLLLSLACASFCAMPIHARIARNSGPYLDFNAGWSYMEFNSWNGDGPVGNINVGYKINPYIGVEGGYTYIGLRNDIHDHLYYYDLAGKFILPISSSNFDCFAKLGGAFVGDSDHLNSSPTLFGGLGLSYWFTPHFSSTFQVAGTTKKNYYPNTVSATLGVSFLF